MGLQVIQARFADTGISNAGHGILGPLAEPQGASQGLADVKSIGRRLRPFTSSSKPRERLMPIHHKKAPAEAGGDASLVETGGLRD
jgi:hypothetical protein